MFLAFNATRSNLSYVITMASFSGSRLHIVSIITIPMQDCFCGIGTFQNVRTTLPLVDHVKSRPDWLTTPCNQSKAGYSLAYQTLDGPHVLKGIIMTVVRTTTHMTWFLLQRMQNNGTTKQSDRHSTTAILHASINVMMQALARNIHSAAGWRPLRLGHQAEQKCRTTVA